jgi:tRNA(fMet)-specific endonuclease VapC
LVKYLLDTNVVSEPTKDRPSARLVRRLARHDGEIALSSISWHEINYGLERMPDGRKRARLREYYAAARVGIPILAYDERAAEWHARERARLKKTPPFVDGQIAAVAAANDLVLVTADRDFSVFDVRVEDWLNGA